MTCEWCHCRIKGRHKMWCRSPEAIRIKKEQNIKSAYEVQEED